MGFPTISIWDNLAIENSTGNETDHLMGKI